MLLEGKSNTFFRLVGQPRFIYGTAWKKERSAALVKDALAAGFRAVDTACQPRHYNEALVGEGLRDAFQAGICTRQDVFLQTKFTQLLGQDPNNMPYSQDDALEDQIKKSVETSLRNLRPREDLKSADDSYIDCLLLHSPIHPFQRTLVAWRVLESYVPHHIRTLGISNFSLEELQVLHTEARVQPSTVQNRFYPKTMYDTQLRQFCDDQGIIYESFWTLTGNPNLLKSSPVLTLAKEIGITKEEALYALVMSKDIAVLNGTTNLDRMKGDLNSIVAVDKWAGSNVSKWRETTEEFQSVIVSGRDIR